MHYKLYILCIYFDVNYNLSLLINKSTRTMKSMLKGWRFSIEKHN